MNRRRRPTRTLAERELMATMTGGNVPPAAEEPEPRSSSFGLAEIGFVTGFLLATLGIALWSLPLGVIFLGVGMLLAGWWAA